MANSNSNSKGKPTVNSADQFADVLYQKLGEKWFAFSIINEEVFMSPVSDDRISEIKCDTSAVANIRASNAEFDNEAA